MKNGAHAPNLTLAAMSLGYGVVQLDVTIVNTSIGAIGESLGGGVSDLQWIVTAYTIAFAALILTGGALGDRLGAKRMFLAGFATFTVASLACALAPNTIVLIIARGIEGLGAAILVPNSLALLNHTYSGEKSRGQAIAIWAAGASFGLTAGPLVGGGLIAAFGWRSIFLVNLPLGAAGLLLTWRHAKETTRSPERSLDLPAQAAAIAALGCLAAALIGGGHAGWTEPLVMGGFTAFAGLTALFVIRERRTGQPMLPLALFRRRLFSLTTVVGLLVNIAFYGFIFVLSLYYQRVNQLSALATGLAFVPMMGAVLVANIFAATLSERLGTRHAIAIAATISAAGCGALLGIQQGSGYWTMCAQLIALGAGLGLLVPPLTSAQLGSVKKSQSGVAAGVLNSARQTGSVLGVALFGSLVTRNFVAGLHTSLVIATCLFAASAAAILLGAPKWRGLYGNNGTR